MKHLLALTVLTIILSCGNKGIKTEKFRPKIDTSRVLATYIDFSDTLIKTGPTYQILRDAIRVDSFLKVHKVRDSIYFYKPKFYQGKLNDSTWFPIIRPAICLDKSFDSCINRLSELISQMKKQDSLNKTKKP